MREGTLAGSWGDSEPAVEEGIAPGSGARDRPASVLLSHAGVSRSWRFYYVWVTPAVESPASGLPLLPLWE
jgi:hypothetical protein